MISSSTITADIEIEAFLTSIQAGTPTIDEVKQDIVSQALMRVSGDINRADVLDKLLKRAKEFKLDTVLNTCIEDTTPLGTAVYNGNPRAVDLLLSAGAVPSALNENGMTPLNEVLFEAPIDDEDEPLTQAEIAGRYAAVEVLLTKGGMEQIFIKPPLDNLDLVDPFRTLDELVVFPARHYRGTGYGEGHIKNILRCLYFHLAVDERVPSEKLEDIRTMLMPFGGLQDAPPSPIGLVNIREFKGTSGLSVDTADNGGADGEKDLFDLSPRPSTATMPAAIGSPTSGSMGFFHHAEPAGSAPAFGILDEALEELSAAWQENSEKNKVDSARKTNSPK